MSRIDDDRKRIVAELEEAERFLAGAEVVYKNAIARTADLRSQLGAHDMAAAAAKLLATPSGSEPAPSPVGVHENNSQRPESWDQRDRQIVQAYKGGIRTKDLAEQYKISPSTVSVTLSRYERRTGEKIERHTVRQGRYRRDPAPDAAAALQ